MNFLGKVIEFLDTGMTEPVLYGWFHILFLVITAVATVLLCKFFKEGTEKQVRTILFVTAVVVIISEIYKQINYTFSFDGNVITADYQWYAFPWQFCSTPMYVGLAAALWKKGKIHDSLCAYLASFALFAGVGVMVYPETVFIETIGINIQTMICHGSMISIGVYLLYTGYVKAEHKTAVRAMPVFAVMVALAVIMNEIAYASGLLETEDFNMFFVSPHQEPSLPVYSLIQGAVPYPWCLIIYIAGFTLAAYVMVLLAMGLKRLAAAVSKKIATRRASRG
jgi:hypothetical protein